jgi:hypothetical protein
VLTARRPTPAPYATRRERVRFAHGIDLLLRDASAPCSPRQRPLADPDVVRACAPALRRVRDALLDAHVDVRPQTLRLVAAFACDGARSPLYGRDAGAAAQRADELRAAFTLGMPPLAHAARRAP